MKKLLTLTTIFLIVISTFSVFTPKVVAQTDTGVDDPTGDVFEVGMGPGGPFGPWPVTGYDYIDIVHADIIQIDSIRVKCIIKVAGVIPPMEEWEEHIELDFCWFIDSDKNKDTGVRDPMFVNDIGADYRVMVSTRWEALITHYWDGEIEEVSRPGIFTLSGDTATVIFDLADIENPASFHWVATTIEVLWDPSVVFDKAPNIGHATFPPAAPKIEIIKYEITNLYKVSKMDIYFNYIMKFPRSPIYSRVDVYVSGDEFVDHICLKLAGVKPETEIVRLTKIEPSHYATTLLADEFSKVDILNVLYLVLQLVAAHYGFSLAPAPWYKRPTIPDVTLSEIIAVDIYGREYHKTVGERIPTYYDALALDLLLWDKGEIVLTVCPVDLLVIDPDGYRIGSFYENGAFVTELNEISGAFYTGRDIELEFIFIPHVPGDYVIEVIGAGAGDYTLATFVFQEGQGSSQTISGRIVEGGVYVYIVSISATGAMTFNPDPAGTLGHLREFLSRLPENVFMNNANQRKKALCNKIDEALAKIQAEEYEDAINKLENDVRAKMNGDETADDWITDPTTQAELCIIIDHIIADIQMIVQ